MSLDLNLVNQSIRAVIANALGFAVTDVRPANQNGPTGNITQTFATVLCSEVDNEGVDAVQFLDTGVAHQLTESVVGVRRIVASVQFFRTNAYTNASRLGGLLRNSASILLLNSLGLSLVRAGRVTNLSQVVDTYWEERAQMELEFYAASVEQAAVGTFVGVPITINVDAKTKLSRSTEVNLDS